jgi:hypothetical protein
MELDDELARDLEKENVSMAKDADMFKHKVNHEF